MSSPGIFLDEFVRTEERDKLFGAFGRALAFATRFEQNCRGLLWLIKVKTRPDKYLDKSNMNDFVEELSKLCLGKLSVELNLKRFYKDKPVDIDEVIGKARLARNENAHSIATGLCGPIEVDININECLSRLKTVCRDIINADIIVSWIMSVLQNDELPNTHFISEYEDNVLKWIC